MAGSSWIRKMFEKGIELKKQHGADAVCDFSLGNPDVPPPAKTRAVLEEIAALGKDCVIVGRNADVILKDYAPFNIFVCASTEAKVQRCQERAPEGENLTEKELLRKMKKIDEVRAQTRAIMSDAAWGQRSAYHITINTTGWDIKALVPAVADFAGRWFERKK